MSVKSGMNDTAVVTCITGGFDSVVEQPDLDVDYIFYTDGSVMPDKDSCWQAMNLPESNLDPRRRAKQPKLHPHSFSELTEYNYVIWIDGSMHIKSSKFVEEIKSYLKNGLVLSPHMDDRHCGYGEATIRVGKYANEPLQEQCEFYLSEGFPYDYGLYEAGVQARDMTTPGLSDFGECWLQQNLDWSYNDQVSCGYALWKTNFTPDVLPRSWRKFDWLSMNLHRLKT